MPTPTPPTDSYDAALAASADALATMESEAAEFFAAKAAAAPEAAPLNPVAPALEAAAAAKAAPPKAVAKAPAPVAKPTGKVPGAPTLAKPATAKAVEAAAPAAAKPAAKSDELLTLDESNRDPNPPEDYSDLPRKFTGGLKSHNWDKLNRRADHYEALAMQRAAELEAARAEVEAAKAATANGAPPVDVQQRLTALQTERDSLLARLEAVAVEKSPRFEAQFKPRQQAALAQAKAAVGPADAAKIEQLLAMGESAYRDEQVEALLASLPPLRATKLTQAVADLDRLTAERASLAAQGSDLYKQWQAEEQSARDRQTAERVAAASRVFDSELKEWEAIGVTPEEAAAARSVYTGKDATLQDAARASFWAVKGPQIAQMAQDLQGKVAELEGELAKLRGAQPGVGAAASGALPQSGGDDDFDPSLSLAEATARAALRQGVRFGA